VNLQADNVQTLLSKQHIVVRLFMETKNALYKGEEPTSPSTTTTTSSSQPPPQLMLTDIT